MPIFHMSIFNVPPYVLKTLESIRSRFFNGQDHKTRKASWVKWDNVLTSRDKGGLGVASLYALNRGLMDLAILLSKVFFMDKSDQSIHGDDGKLDRDVIIGGQTCWTSIVKEARSLKGTGINVVDLIRLKLGNGDSSSFWEDKWRVRSGAEESQFNSLLEIVQVINLVPCEDRYFWSLESEGDYSVASIRKLIDEKRFQE
nr:RNA-directed DNA polymerase, eukaryota, reverse transcriptase zinc-binding domain protein [Tanacetum cinerariifolium]